jgi:hypothetical protein
MQTTLHYLFSVVLFALCFFTTSYAQQHVPKYQFGIGAGASIYQGDLVPSAIGSYRTLKPGVSLFASRLLSPAFALRGNISLMGLKGDDSRYNHPVYRQQRNFRFDTPVIELSALGEWNILSRNYVSRGFAPYVVAGVGYSFLKIRRDWSNLNVAWFGAESQFMDNLASDAQRSLPKGMIVFPVGIAVRYYFSDKLGISAESSYRITRTDYLDGFSRSANPARKDQYHSHSIGIVYRLGKKNMLDCPVLP